MYKVEYDRFAKGYLVVHIETDNVHSKWTNRFDALLCARDLSNHKKKIQMTAKKETIHG